MIWNNFKHFFLIQVASSKFSTEIESMKESYTGISALYVHSWAFCGIFGQVII